MLIVISFWEQDIEISHYYHWLTYFFFEDNNYKCIYLQQQSPKIYASKEIWENSNIWKWSNPWVKEESTRKKKFNTFKLNEMKIQHIKNKDMQLKQCWEGNEDVFIRRKVSCELSKLSPYWRVLILSIFTHKKVTVRGKACVT